MILFDNDRHEGFAPLELPPKSEGQRPASQFGFTAPDGSEWSVLVRRGPLASVDATLGSSIRLWLTLAHRVNGRTGRVGTEPLVNPRRELTIDPQEVDEAFDLQRAIEDETVRAWEAARAVPAAMTGLLSELDALGLQQTKGQSAPDASQAD